MIVIYIEVYRDRFGVEPICRVLSDHGMPIAPSTCYALRGQPVSDRDWTDGHMPGSLRTSTLGFEAGSTTMGPSTASS